MVYLVGAGPGDPGLITVRGLQCLREADVVVFDYLVNPQLLAEARPEAERIYVGKKGNQHTLEQHEINQLLVEQGQTGKTIVRLKGGDPYVFGRGGEEALALAEAGLAFEVVPGITAGVAAPAYTGIPVTHRGLTSTLGFVTGHEDPSKETSSIEWDALARACGTLVFYMGVKNLPDIVRHLVAAGRSFDTPCAVIRWGTTPRQKSVVGTLQDIEMRVTAAGVGPPAIFVVGEVVALRDKLNWFENRPLFGKRVVVTRSRDQASDFVSRLAALGAEPIEFPTIRICDPESLDPLDDCLRRLDNFHWVVFTSVNGVEKTFGRLKNLGLDTRALKGVKVCSIGPATTRELEKHGLLVDCQPQKYVAEAVLEALKAAEGNLSGKKFLLPRADLARSFLPEELQKAGAEVTEIVAYRTMLATSATETVLKALESDGDLVIAFTSSSTVNNFVEVVKDHLLRFKEKALFASIGPVTTKTAREKGIEIIVEASEYTIPGLVDAIVRHYSTMSRE